jgi:hypothetical protein
LCRCTPQKLLIGINESYFIWAQTGFFWELVEELITKDRNENKRDSIKIIALKESSTNKIPTKLKSINYFGWQMEFIRCCFFRMENPQRD